MKDFVINRHGRMVFPSSFSAGLDFSELRHLDQLEAVIERDFTAKAPSGDELVRRIQGGRYGARYDLLRDVALNLVWASRYSMTMYVKRPMRWRDVPRRRDDLFLPVATPWRDRGRTAAAVAQAYAQLAPAWDQAAEQRIFDILFRSLQERRHSGAELSPIEPTVAEMVARPEALTYRLRRHDPDYPHFALDQLVDCFEEVAELEALRRLAMRVHNEYPWDGAQASLATLDEIDDDDFVVVYAPRDVHVLEFVRRARSTPTRIQSPSAPPEAHRPVRPFPSIPVPERFELAPRIESLAVLRGEVICSNDDVVRNAVHSWSPMSAESIRRKTGIEQRVYTARGLDEIALDAARAALAHAGREPAEVGAVVVSSCTMTRLIPSLSSWLSGQLGIYQTHGSYDIVAACAGFAYGLVQAVHLLQQARRPILVVWAEKFSDKIGNVRTSRMLFGDGAAAAVISPGEVGSSDIELLQILAGGPVSEVDSIIWPNPEFDNDITVYGPEVRALAQRYLMQMTDEIRSRPHPDGRSGSLLDAVDLVVPHQANRSMVTELAAEAGVEADRLYFNIERVGNTSSASIPLAIHDAVHDGVIDRPMRLFTPCFGAGAVGGYTVIQLDPAIVAREATVGAPHAAVAAPSARLREPAVVAA